MQFTLFGYPKSGKTTLFNLLTGAGIQTVSYDAGSREPHMRNSPIPDDRLDRLSELYPEKEKKQAVIDFIDLAGMAFGEVKDSAYLSHLRKSDGLCHVVRGFEDEQIAHPKGRIDISEDIQAMEDELILADTFSAESRLKKLEKELSRAKNPEGEKEQEILTRLIPHLEKAMPLREMDLTAQEEKHIRSFAFLSLKPLLHVINLDENDLASVEEPEKFAASLFSRTGIMAFCGKIEEEIMELDEKEAGDFLEEYGLKELSTDKFLKASYDLLDLITFYTIGQHEVKAWPLQKNATAVQAAGAIHTDMEKGFIKAEVVPLADLLQAGSFQAAKESAALRLEGKDYLIQDGDVVYFRFAK